MSVIIEEANTPKPRILCTEDNEDSRELLRLMLELEGFDVTCSGSSAEALSLAKARKFDLYLLDSRLPDMPGYALCQQLRDFDLTTPVLFYSGMERDEEKAIAAGAQGYIVKPAEPQKLIAEIKRLI